MTLTVETARPNERETVVALLKHDHLPTEDLPADLAHFVIAREDATPVGVAGLEILGSVGLMRSVAVHPAHQRRGIAAQMIDRLLHRATAVSVEEVYLITTTARPYFERHGFLAVAREQVPPAIQRTQQFSTLCPSSAVVMIRLLNKAAA